MAYMVSLLFLGVSLFVVCVKLLYMIYIYCFGIWLYILYVANAGGYFMSVERIVSLV